MDISKLKCKIFKLHDWEILRRENKEKIIYKIEDEIFLNDNFKKNYSKEVLVQKVCLSCGLKIDEISDFKKDYIQKRIEKNKRQNEAILLFNKK